jgi:hypothetical protein
MNQRQEPPAPAHYELRIDGHLDDQWSAWFGGLTLVREDDGTTTLRGPVTDQAELHGLLAKVRDLGTTLISVKTIDAPDRRSLSHGQEPLPPNSYQEAVVVHDGSLHCEPLTASESLTNRERDHQ